MRRTGPETKPACKLLSRASRGRPAGPQAPRHPTPFPPVFVPECVTIRVPPGLASPSSSPSTTSTRWYHSLPQIHRHSPETHAVEGLQGAPPPTHFSSPRTALRSPETPPFGPLHSHQRRLSSRRKTTHDPSVPFLAQALKPHSCAQDWGSGPRSLPTQAWWDPSRQTPDPAIFSLSAVPQSSILMVLQRGLWPCAPSGIFPKMETVPGSSLSKDISENQQRRACRA